MNGWGVPSLQLSEIPAEALPEGIDASVHTITTRPYNSPQIIWLQRGDLVYQLGSTYNRPQDLALIFALIASLQFDPEVEATLRAADILQGDETVLRQRIADSESPRLHQLYPVTRFVRRRPITSTPM